MQKFFQFVDYKKVGKISADDIFPYIVSRMAREDLDAILAQYDNDQDEMITEEEFLMFCRHPGIILAEKVHPALQALFEGNKKFVKERVRDDKFYFKKMMRGQSPKYLYIGCSDSRIPAETMMGLSPGEMFIHRNIANLVVNTDFSLLSVVSYAVEKLRVEHIIVCGHYSCGGVMAASQNREDLGLIDNWLREIRNLIRIHGEELSELTDEAEVDGSPSPRHKKLVEINVAEQMFNLYKTNIVQKAQAFRNGFPMIHGLVYDVSNGYIKHIQIDHERYERELEIFKIPFEKPPENDSAERPDNQSLRTSEGGGLRRRDQLQKLQERLSLERKTESL